MNIFLVEKSGNVSSDGTLERKAEEQLEDILEQSSSPAWSDVSEPSSSALDDGNGSKGSEERIATVTEDAGKSEENLSHLPDEQKKETEVPSEHEGGNAAATVPGEKKETVDENYGTDQTNG